MKWTRALPLLLCFLVSACLQTENSSSLDADMIGNDAYVNILVNNCASCHNEVLLTDDGLIDAGWVVPGDPENSKIYYRLADSDGPNGPKDMPSGGALVMSELEIIRLWIESL